MTDEWIEQEHQRLIEAGYTPGVFGLIPPCPPAPLMMGMEESMRQQLRELAKAGLREAVNSSPETGGGTEWRPGGLGSLG